VDPISGRIIDLHFSHTTGAGKEGKQDKQRKQHKQQEQARQAKYL
jgi:hypothetical protein